VLREASLDVVEEEDPLLIAPTTELSKNQQEIQLDPS
jgi:hypothetical protein